MGKKKQRKESQNRRGSIDSKSNVIIMDEQKAEFCKNAFIPDGVSLELENFEEFYEKRKALLTAKIRQLLG